MSTGSGRQMIGDLFASGAKSSSGKGVFEGLPSGGIELAGKRQWLKSLLALPVLYAMVVIVCALAGLSNWFVVLVVMSSLTLVFEALLLRAGAPSLVVSPGAVVQRTRWRTTTVRAEDVNDILVRHAMNGPVVVISTESAKVGVPLPCAYRKPMARTVLASFLRRAGVDLPALRGLGLPAPVQPARAVAGPILSRSAGPGPGPAWPDVPVPPLTVLHDRAGPAGPSGSAGFFGVRAGGLVGVSAARAAGGPAAPGHAAGGATRAGGEGLISRRRPTPVRVGGRVIAWLTLAAFALTAAIGLLRVFY